MSPRHAFSLSRMWVFIFAVVAVALLWGQTTTVAAPLEERWAPFYLPWEAPDGAVGDARFLLDAPAGKHGFIRVRDGHFWFPQAGRARFWGVNLSGEANFPPLDVAPRLADRLAKFGFNLVRMHGLDTPWGNTFFGWNAPDTLHLKPERFEKFDRLVAELIKRGIYTNLNLHVGRKFTAADGVPQAEWLGYGKYCVIFDPRMIELQKEYARQLLTHRNPHTGRTYAEEPAVVIIELTNEDSLFLAWTSGFLRGRQTTRPASDWCDIPPYYAEELTRFYNEWLAKRYPTRADLVRAWQQGARHAGAPLLQNGMFTDGAKHWDFWAAEKSPARWEITGDTAQVTIHGVDGTPWHVMLTQRNLKLQKGMKYRVTFRARASATRTVSAEVCHNDPWRGYGYAHCDLGEQWQDYQFTFTVPDNDDNVRLSFHFGQATGTVWIANVNLHEAPIHGLRDDEDPARGTVRRLDPSEFDSATAERFRDEGRFYFELEQRYYETMRRFLRDELKTRALIEGTNENYGLPSLRAQAMLDLMDCHAYWQHPRFPRQAWSNTDWDIENTSMLDTPARCTISAISRSAVLGKPMTVSEYNHPFPNDYGCEMPLLLAAYASLQDWDAVYSYTFGHKWTERELSGNVITGYFDICNEASKLAQMPTASLLFQRGDVKPARRLVKRCYDEHRLYDSLKEKRWDLIQFFTMGELSPLLPLVHRVRIEDFTADRTTRAEEIGFNASNTRIASDTGELLWETTGQRTGRLTINTSHTQAALGWIGNQILRTTDVEFRLNTPFCAVSLIALDGRPLANSKKILLVAVARSANSGMQWNANRTSIGNHWGNPPLLIEPVTGRITLQRADRASNLSLVPLDGTGQPQLEKATPLSQQHGTYIIPLTEPTVWYVLQ